MAETDVLLDRIAAWFPLIGRIEDATLRGNVVKTIEIAIKEGGWTEETAPLCPVSLLPSCEGISLIDHVNCVAKSCLDAAESINDCKTKPQKLDLDMVLAGALLHDAGKFVEFSLSSEGQAVNRGLPQRHPAIGADLAKSCGLPEAVCDIIRWHSVEGEGRNHSPESQLVRTIDLLVFDLMQ